MKAYLYAAVAALALAGAPASAKILKFTITNIGGTDQGDYSFELDDSRVPDIVLSDSVRYAAGAPNFSPKLNVTYTDVPGQGSGTIEAGVTFFAPIQQGGLMIGFLPFGNLRLINTPLIENVSFDRSLPKDQNKAIFKLGTFDISTTPRNNGPRPFDNYRITIAAVPEPATWAMMLAGFGAVGLGARRRKMVVVSA